MKYLLLLVCGAVHAACPSNQTCLSWIGDGHYTDDKVIPADFVVTYTVLYGVKGGPYLALRGYNGAPTQTFNVQFATPASPKLCFVVTATADTPDSAGTLSKQISTPTAELCDKAPLPAPTGGSIER